MENNAPDFLWAHLTPKLEKKGVKLRLAHIFKRSGGTSLDTMGEIKLLNTKDLTDFVGWFEEAGYPILSN